MRVDTIKGNYFIFFFCSKINNATPVCMLYTYPVLFKENQYTKMSSQDFFDNIIDPYEANFQKGKEDGRHAALQAGYNDGYQLGKLKSLEIGVELGYMSSVCTMILQNLEEQETVSVDNRSQVNNSTRIEEKSDEKVGVKHKTTNVEESILERKRKRLLDLLKAIEKFPKPETIFKRHGNDLEKVAHLYSPRTNQNDSNNNLCETDIVSTIQRLRAKFKAILVQNQISNLRLKDVMDNTDNIPSREDAHSSMNESSKKDAISRIDEW